MDATAEANTELERMVQQTRFAEVWERSSKLWRLTDATITLLNLIEDKDERLTLWNGLKKRYEDAGFNL